MADAVKVVTASSVINSGPGVITGIVISCAAGAPRVTLYDATRLPSTAIIFIGSVSPYNQVVKFFDDAHAIRFGTGIYAFLSAACSVTIWIRQL